MVWWGGGIIDQTLKSYCEESVVSSGTSTIQGTLFNQHLLSLYSELLYAIFFFLQEKPISVIFT